MPNAQGDRVDMVQNCVRPPRALAIALPALLFAVTAPVHAGDPAAALGKQRAVDSRLEWEIHDANHPVLGAIRFAHTRTAFVTPVGNAKVYSSAYVSCEKGAGKIAIELTNQASPTDPGGLRPAKLPHLVCIRPAGTGGAKAVQQVLDTSWHVNQLGDAMARGLRPSTLRACAAIGIVQDVALPKGWARSSVPLHFEITPYDRDLDSIFVTCGEMSAYAVAGTVSAEPAPASAPPWKTARCVARGRTNVRAGPSLRSQVVAELNPGTTILVQSTGGAWWRAKPRTGAKFEGYIREDRLVLR